MDKIKSMNDVNELHRNGANICKGCPFEHAASCHESRLNTCNGKLNKLNNEKQENA